MKSKEEIQEKLGIKFEYYTRSSYIVDIDEDVSKKYLQLSKEDEYKIMDLQIQSLQDGDIETAQLCESILAEQFHGIQLREDNTKQQKERQYNSLKFAKIRETISRIDNLDENSSIEELEDIVKTGKFCGIGLMYATESIEKFESVQGMLFEKYSLELNEIDTQNLDFEQIDVILSRWDEISRLCDSKEIDSKRKSASQVIEQKIDEKIKLLDEELESLRGNSNQEEKINEIQNLIERIEDRYLDFKTKAEYNRTIERWENKKAEAVKLYGRYTEKPTVSPIGGVRYEKWYVGRPASEWMVRDELQSNVLNHKQQRLKEEARLKAEQEAKERAEEQARLKAEQEAKEKAEEQARLKAEQEAKEKAEEQARLKAEQEAKERAEEQARLKAEQEAKERAEEQARLKAEQEAKQRAEEQARIKAEQEAKEREEQARLKAEQEAKQRAEEQARLRTEQKEKERQALIEKEIAEYEQYEELISRKPELDKLFYDLFYEDFSATVNGHHISERMVDLLDDLKKLPENERKIILQRYNGLADLTINEQGQIIKDGIVQDLPERKDNEQESTPVEQIEVETSEEELEEQFAETTIGLDYDKMIEQDLEYTRTHQTYQPSQVVQDYWNRVNSQQGKEYEQQQPEKIRPREESIRDTIGDEKDRQSRMQMQEVKTPTVDLWMNRFDSWYSAIDRVSQNAKAKFVKMKSDIVNAISTKIKERMNKREINTQEQDSSER